MNRAEAREKTDCNYKCRQDTTNTNIYQVKRAAKNARPRINISERCEKTWLLLTLLFVPILFSARLKQQNNLHGWFFFYLAVWPIIGSYLYVSSVLFVCVCVLCIGVILNCSSS